MTKQSSSVGANDAPQSYHDLSPLARLVYYLESLPDLEPLEISEPAPAAPPPVIPPPQRPTRRARKPAATKRQRSRAGQRASTSKERVTA